MKKSFLFLLLPASFAILLSSCITKENPTIYIRDLYETGLGNVQLTVSTRNSDHVTITESGVCYSKQTLPTISDEKINFNFARFDQEVSVENLDPNTDYYFCSFYTTSKGTIYGEVKYIQTGNRSDGMKEYTINGINYYLHDDARFESNRWCSELTRVYANSTDGQVNTSKIAPLDNYSAAARCENLDINGYDDWYLPSYQEMSDFRDYGYEFGDGLSTFWTSTEINSSEAIALSEANWPNEFSTYSKLSRYDCVCIRRD